MRTRDLRLGLVLVAGLALAALPGFAQGRGHGRGKSARDEGIFVGRGGIVIEPLERSGRPPGWDRGRKTGWGNCHVPPGQAKKEGCGSSIVIRWRGTVRRHPVIILRETR
jgi:hypothetical protein